MGKERRHPRLSDIQELDLLYDCIENHNNGKVRFIQEYDIFFNKVISKRLNQFLISNDAPYEKNDIISLKNAFYIHLFENDCYRLSQIFERLIQYNEAKKMGQHEIDQLTPENQGVCRRLSSWLVIYINRFLSDSFDYEKRRVKILSVFDIKFKIKNPALSERELHNRIVLNQIWDEMNSKQERTIFKEYFFEGYTLSEIANHLDTSIGNVFYKLKKIKTNYQI